MIDNDLFIKATLYVAMEYAQHGDLRSYLRKSRRKKQTLYANANSFTPLSQAALLKFALDAASGLSHLAIKQVSGQLHRLLKTVFWIRNLLYNTYRYGVRHKGFNRVSKFIFWSILKIVRTVRIKSLLKFTPRIQIRKKFPCVYSSAFCVDTDLLSYMLWDIGRLCGIRKTVTVKLFEIN